MYKKKTFWAVACIFICAAVSYALVRNGVVNPMGECRWSIENPAEVSFGGYDVGYRCEGGFFFKTVGTAQVHWTNDAKRKPQGKSHLQTRFTPIHPDWKPTDRDDIYTDGVRYFQEFDYDAADGWVGSVVITYDPDTRAKTEASCIQALDKMSRSFMQSMSNDAARGLPQGKRR